MKVFVQLANYDEIPQVILEYLDRTDILVLSKIVGKDLPQLPKLDDHHRLKRIEWDLSSSSIYPQFDKWTETSRAWTQVQYGDRNVIPEFVVSAVMNLLVDGFDSLPEQLQREYSESLVKERFGVRKAFPANRVAINPDGDVLLAKNYGGDTHYHHSKELSDAEMIALICDLVFSVIDLRVQREYRPPKYIFERVDNQVIVSMLKPNGYYAHKTTFTFETEEEKEQFLEEFSKT